MSSNFQLPQDYRIRPVAVIGAGVLGRRIGCVWASAGYNVRIRDPSAEQRADAIAYIKENVASYAEKTGQAPGDAGSFEDLADAVFNAWLVIEAVPEKAQLKIDTFAELETLTASDCILASNSSSYKSSEILEKVSAATKSRILNMHYYMPPRSMVLELMTDGYTADNIFPFLVERCKESGTLPYVARKESTGFIFNRLWAAIKRETLSIMAEGVSVPEEIDSMWTTMFKNGGSGPCRMMDSVGLDTVAFIESHYVKERGLSPENTVDFLEKNYLDQGKLGTKCSLGGLYPPSKTQEADGPRLLVLDVGLSAAVPTLGSGEILEFSADGKNQRVLVGNQALPDGVVLDSATSRMFWTNMGIPGKIDGAVYSANLDGTDVQTVISPGSINTPKQLALDSAARKLFFSDREGCRVYRCNFDGSDLEALISNGDYDQSQDTKDVSKWCVGITVASKLGKFYWTQKGPSKGRQGRIFCADIPASVDQSPLSRDNVHCLLEGLPEPIDLEIDEESGYLYWTDRGEIPFGNSLNRARLNESGQLATTSSTQKFEVLTRHLKEAIGLKLDTKRGQVYLTDLGGHIYRCDMDGKNKEVIFHDDHRALTGIALL